MKNIEEQVNKLAAQLAKKKAQLQAQQVATRNRERARERKIREQKIYRLGGMVEKMGLDNLDDELLLGILFVMNKNVSKPSWCRKFIDYGKPFQVIGKKLLRPEVPSMERILASSERAQQVETNQAPPLVEESGAADIGSTSWQSIDDTQGA